MYQIKPIILKNATIEKKDLIIQFDDPKMAIVAEFLMADAPLMNGAVLEEMDLVIDGKKDFLASSGNRCKLEISPDRTFIYDLFAGIEGFDAYLPCEIATSKLRRLIVMWLDELELFKRNQ